LTHLDGTGVAKKTRTELLWTPDELHRTLELVPEDFQLYLLLMLNCGFTNIDVGTLLKSEVRLDEGRIVRQRTKTRRHEHPPVVNYKLWPRTAELLRSHVSPDPVLALTNRRGGALCVSKLVVENGITRETVWSSLIRRYGQMKKAKPELPDKQLKFLRKTGSSKLRSDRRFFSLDSLYLGHSWVTIADKHYNVFDGQPYAPLDEAIEWLGEQFGFKTESARKPGAAKTAGTRRPVRGRRTPTQGRKRPERSQVAEKTPAAGTPGSPAAG
jgi:hypothetical protein